ncbi:hypothetical protein CFOL_v3_27777 [Cephalotus follicularis]|uniref:Uncharacterized protein n=1 Tax=Cephalotus follicularis TaxID=3775 RepID=A0A1Q3CW98_CEPFO|nr:hypothetical protein CFOL_v3_27777 [Cephalotus follicularis]
MQPVMLIQTLFRNWFASSTKSQFGMVKCFVCCFVYCFFCWDLWKARCQSVFEDVRMDSAAIIRAVNQGVQVSLINFKPPVSSSYLESLSLSCMNICLKNLLIKVGCWIKLIAPKQGQLKLNTNGSTRNVQATEGGVVRDSKG